jgi:hypothetical protein
MSPNKNMHSVISSQELEMLNGPKPAGQASGVDKNFKYRNAFLVAGSVILIIRLIFFPQVLNSDFKVIPALGEISGYFQIRGFISLSIFCIYIYSYIKDWHFARVAMTVAAVALSSLLADGVLIALLTTHPVKPHIVALLMVRVGLIYCLFMNSIRDNRAPTMPRTLFS